MLFCSHGIRYEFKCQKCVQEALLYIRNMPKEPSFGATPEQRKAFWEKCYKQTVVPPVY